MTIGEILGMTDSLKHNTYTFANKVGWLNRLDGMVKQQIIDTHEGGDAISFAGYDENTSRDTQLLVPAPYDEIYQHWLAAMIDYHNGETSLYNESISMFNTLWRQFENHYNRTHMPLGHSFRYF